MNLSRLRLPAHAATEKGVSRQWVYSLMKRKKVEIYTIGGVDFVDLDEVLNYGADKPADKRKPTKKAK